MASKDPEEKPQPEDEDETTKRAEKQRDDEDESKDPWDEALDETFPASDPPAW